MCLTFKSERDIELLVQYESESVFVNDHAEVKVPASLLTKEDMKSAYLSAAYLANKINEYQSEHRDRQKV